MGNAWDVVAIILCAMLYERGGDGVDGWLDLDE